MYEFIKVTETHGRSVIHTELNMIKLDAWMCAGLRIDITGLLVSSCGSALPGVAMIDEETWKNLVAQVYRLRPEWSSPAPALEPVKPCDCLSDETCSLCRPDLYPGGELPRREQ